MEGHKCKNWGINGIETLAGGGGVETDAARYPTFCPTSEGDNPRTTTQPDYVQWTPRGGYGNTWCDICGQKKFNGGYWRMEN